MGQLTSTSRVTTDEPNQESIRTLYDELRKGKLQVPNPPGNNILFIPASVFDEKITAERVLAIAGPSSKLCDSYRAELIVKRAKRTIAILVLSGCEKIVYDLLIRDGMVDSDLPLSPSSPDGTILRSAGPQKQRIFTSFEKLSPREVDGFCRDQWLALAPKFGDIKDHKELDSNYPLPFCDKEIMASTMFSTVFRATLHPAHHAETAEKDGIQVAVKELKDENQFKQERSNLTITASLNNSHIIKHIATYEVKNTNGTTTYSIIFPLASGGNLQTFWDTEEPRTPELRQWSLEQILGLATAIRDLHMGFQGEKHCRHGDLKPLNLLHFKDPSSKGLGRLVLGDLGISKIHEQVTADRKCATQTRATTPHYEPPEARGIRNDNDSSSNDNDKDKNGSAAAGQDQGKPWSRKYDMWSLGCIFLEFAVWLFSDVGTLDKFRKRRGSGTFYKVLPAEADGGEEQVVVCPVAQGVLEQLRAGFRGDKDDAAAAPGPWERFVDLIEGELLIPEAERRCGADRLVAELERIVEDARRDPMGEF
ncbi:kinase-like domain-containing protein [Chaetomium fimeti]|uniref:Kinase-like domain-containing protein n=1 Tax=Chaetomium fimeti TaxID=1854472 RepID=A0AAE0LMY5_9PEZI|nr:kinase-like domain-containing protein [Chaetomium fimeti]